MSGSESLRRFLVVLKVPEKLLVLAKNSDHLAEIGVGLGHFLVPFLVVENIGLGKLLLQLLVFDFDFLKLAEHNLALLGA